MKYICYIAINLVIFCSFFISVVSPSLASGITSSDTSPGQVRVQNNGGTLFLSTAVNDGGSSHTNSGISTERDTTTNNYEHASAPSNAIAAIEQPMGFASNLGSYISSLLALIMAVSLLLAFLYFILAGFQWITSGGDKSKTEEARNKIVNAFVGILIVASSFALASFVAWILGFDSINDAVTGINRINPS